MVKLVSLRFIDLTAPGKFVVPHELTQLTNLTSFTMKAEIKGQATPAWHASYEVDWQAMQSLQHICFQGPLKPEFSSSLPLAC